MSNVDTFRRLHINTTPLRLPNAWDAGSARLVEAQGAQAVATTSAGFAWALGYPDGRKLPIDEVVDSARRILRVLTVPLTIDIENGYSDDPKIVAQHVSRLVELGVAGINIEDGADTPSLLASKIEAIREAVARSGGDVFINARSDVFLANLVAKPHQPEESIARGGLYASAGADGLFLPALSDPAQIETIVGEIKLPLNVMSVPNLPDAQALGSLGVRRLSAGGAMSLVVMGKAQALAREFLQSGRSDLFNEGALSYGEAQGLFSSIASN